uniref:Uncharacterized protein n=1 Tax=Trichogramma kaykai TaxID=54128 RepID=A0ABD2WR09_9HYME
MRERVAGSVLKTHISIIHDCCKPFECEICHKSFGNKMIYRKNRSLVKSKKSDELFIRICPSVFHTVLPCDNVIEPIGSPTSL